MSGGSRKQGFKLVGAPTGSNMEVQASDIPGELYAAWLSLGVRCSREPVTSKGTTEVELFLTPVDFWLIQIHPL